MIGYVIFWAILTSYRDFNKGNLEVQLKSSN